MANNATLSWDGLTELRRALIEMPAALQEESVPLVLYHARASEGQLLVRYPTVSGRLRRGVSLKQSRGPGVVSAVLRSKAPHAHLYERGTTIRKTKKHANRGRMPATYTFNRVVVPSRQRLFDDLVQLLVRRGFVVR